MTNNLQTLSNASGFTTSELLESVPNGFIVRTKKSLDEVRYVMEHDHTLHFFRIKKFMECEDIEKQFNIVFIESDDLLLADVVWANICIKGRW